MSSDTWDGLHVCEDCGDAYTTGRYCTTCATQHAIDTFEGADSFEELTDCELYGHDWIDHETMAGDWSQCSRCGLIDA